jgi:hypothetical protein
MSDSLGSLGSLAVSLEANMATFNADMNRAGQVVQQFSSQLDSLRSVATSAFAGMGAAAAAFSLTNSVRSAIEGAAALRNLSTQAGMAVEALSGLAAVGKATGTAADQIASASNKLSKSLATSNEESKGAAAALKALGLSFNTFQSMSPDQRMQSIAVAMNQFQDGSQKSAAAMLLFGKAGAEMLPFLKDLAQAGELHAKVTTEQANQAHEFEVQLGRLRAQGEAWKKTLAYELLPTLNDVVDAMLELRKSAGDAGTAIGGGLVTAIQTVAVLAANVVYVFKQTGTEIGGMAAQITALLRLDFSSFRSGLASIGMLNPFTAAAAAVSGDWKAFNFIRDQVKVDAAAARVEVDKLSTSLLGITNSKAGAGRGGNSWTDPRSLGIGPDFKRQLTGLEGGKGETDPYDALIKSLQEKAAEMAVDTDATNKATEAQKALAKYLEDLRQGYITFNATKEKSVLLALAAMQTSELEKRDSEKQKQLLEASASAMDEYNKSVSAQILKLKEEADTLNLNDIAKQRLNAQHQVEDAALARLFKTRHAANGELITELAVLPQYADKLLLQADADKKIVAALTEKIAAQKLSLQYDQEIASIRIDTTVYLDPTEKAIKLLDLEAAKRKAVIDSLQEDSDERKKLLQQYSDWYAASTDNLAADKFQTLWQNVDQVAQQTFTNIFEGGKSAFTKLRDTLKSTLLDLLYQMTVRKWIFDITAQVSGNGGIASTASSVLSGGSSLLSGGGSSGSLFNSVGSAFMGGYNGVGTATSIASLGGDAMGTAAGTLGAVDSAAASEALGLSATAEATTAATTGIATGIGAGVEAGLASVPVYGWIALAAIALWSAFGSSGGGPKTEGGYNPSGYDISGTDAGGGHPGGVRGDVGSAQQIAQGFTSTLNTAAAAFGVAINSAVSVFYAKDPQGDSQTQLQVVSKNYNRSDVMGGIENVGRSDSDFSAAVSLAAAQLTLVELQKAVQGREGDFLRAADVAGMSTDQITALIQTAENAHTMFAAFAKLGPAFDSVTQLTVDDMTRLVTAFGGMQMAGAKLSAYYDNFYSDAEKKANVVADIVTKLNAAGLTVTADQVGNATREQFRALVEQEVALGANGATAAEALINVNDEFASITPAVDAATRALADNAKSAQDFANSQRVAYAKGLEDIKAKRASLTQQLLQLTDPTAALAASRQQELAAMNGSLWPLQQAIWRQQDLASATKQANSELANMASATQSLVSPLQQAIDGLQKFLDSLQNQAIAALSGNQQYDTAKAAVASAAPEQFQAAAQTFLQAAGMHAGTQADYQRDVAFVEQAGTTLQGKLHSQIDQIMASSNAAISAYLAAAQDQAAAALDAATLIASAADVIGYATALSPAQIATQMALFGHVDNLYGTAPGTPQGQWILDANGIVVDGSHAGGLDRVPFDGYVARLHKNERVQTAAQARASDEWARGMRTGAVSRGTAGTNPELDALVKQLLTEIGQTAHQSRRTADMLDSWDGGHGILIKSDSTNPVITHGV